MRRLILLCCLCLWPLFVQAEVIDIDNAQLRRLLQEGVPLVDIRLQSEWEETGIVAGSRLLTFFDERGRHDAAGWLEKLRQSLSERKAVIVICRSGNRTKPVSQFLAQQGGFATVYNVRKGLKGWLAEGGPVIPASAPLAACRQNRTC